MMFRFYQGPCPTCLPYAFLLKPPDSLFATLHHLVMALKVSSRAPSSSSYILIPLSHLIYRISSADHACTTSNTRYQHLFHLFLISYSWSRAYLSRTTIMYRLHYLVIR